MADLLASGKTGEQRYEDNNADKPVPDLDLITLTQNLKSSLQQTRGWSLSNEKGSSESQAPQLSIIDEANVDDYSTALSQMIQTFVSNDSYLDLDPTSTANNLILIPRKIGNENSPNGTNYSENTSLPFKYRDNLKFTFRAALNNTGPLQVSIPALSGLSGAIDVVDELGANSGANAIVANKFYEIVLTGASGTKKAVLKTPSIQDASTTQKGIAKLITDANLAAGTNATDIVTAIALASLYPNITIGSQNSISFPIKDGGAFKKFTIKSGITGNLSSGNPGTTITFASAFTGAALGGFVIGTTYSGVAESNNTVPTLTVSSMVVTVGGNSAQPYRWFAFGYDN